MKEIYNEIKINETGRNILIGGAWPYANSSLHLGHISSLLPGDILARYHRLKNDNVIYVSGTDCHGTPITERAKKEGVTAASIAERYHEEFVESFNKMNFSYNLYSKTESEFHKNTVEDLFKKMYDNGYIFEKVEEDNYCETCNKFVADRELKLICPECSLESKGDQCDCGHVFTKQELVGATCIDCGNKTTTKDNKNLYIALSKLQKDIEQYAKENTTKWRKNAQNETSKYLLEGLPDRAVTRDLSWGVNIPLPNYEDKKMYVWIEAVLGYLTTTMDFCNRNNLNYENWWKKDKNDIMYMAHGKDNITFHSIIFPGLLLALEDNYKLPDMIVSSEYLNFNDQKFSKSKGIGLTVLEAVEELNVDTLRFYLIKNGPEKKDTNFTLDDYKLIHNEVNNKLGNFINRTLKFKGISEIPEGNMDETIKEILERAYKDITFYMEKMEFKEVTNVILEVLDKVNKYYDDKMPWVLFKEDINKFNDCMYTCSVVCANLSNYIEPIMPTTAQTIRKYLNINEPCWNYIEVNSKQKLDNIEPLFNRL
ncbi:MAG: methionine--tRNA ligase [Bacilli bacterium]|nr:methionine--tRNA ligase [Bacilli bacterium]